MGINYQLPTTFIGVASVLLVQYPIAIAELPEEAIANLAEAVTVMIDGQNPGSGVIIDKKANTYMVLTAKHVIATEDEYDIVTPDKKLYPLDYSQVQKLPNLDLAIAKFTSNENYQVAKLDITEGLAVGKKLYIAGWPHPEAPIRESLFVLTPGNIAAFAPRPLSEGYQIVYTNITKKGMSGGPIFNEEGEVVGIHGQAQGREVYVEDYKTVAVKSGFNLGIPIKALSEKTQLRPTPTPSKVPTSDPITVSPPPENTRQKLYFAKAPKLIDYATTQDYTRVPGATYYFTVSLPPGAQAPLQQLIFQQKQGVDFLERYHIHLTKAFLGTRSQRGDKVPVSLVALDRPNRTMTVTFDPPIPPGNEVTVGLRPVYTPHTSGVYLFRVIAFPPGGESKSLTLGVARFHFYSRF